LGAKQIALYNLRSGLTVGAAPIKSQCSRDYFYTKNAVFEDNFGKLEARQEKLVANTLTTQTVPAPGSPERQTLLTGILFQAGRTATTAADADLNRSWFAGGSMCGCPDSCKRFSNSSGM
jgi:hypothetical protein